MDRWINIVDTNNEILFNLKKEGRLDTYYKWMDLYFLGPGTGVSLVQEVQLKFSHP